jgi:hypothetical protein
LKKRLLTVSFDNHGYYPYGWQVSSTKHIVSIATQEEQSHLCLQGVDAAQLYPNGKQSGLAQADLLFIDGNYYL